MELSKLRKHQIVYHIDGKDRLCEVSADWVPFAMDNDGSSVMPERVLGRSLWDFIRDASIRELYRQLIHRVRTGYPAQFDYRCDAPEWCRKFRMTIRAEEDGTVQFLSQLLWESQRPRVDMLDFDMPRSEQWVRVCSWCQNVVLPDGSWVSVEEAVKKLGLLEEVELPMLSHGICPACHSGMLEQLPPTTDSLVCGLPAACLVDGDAAVDHER